ncbi:MAG TPA: hypothetical protein ENK91_04490, partial [Bacteroidetes bacterium]|nr:hypothetical protein [Bacteroidota bacterium]
EYLTTTISDRNGAYLSDLLKPGKYFIKILGYTPPSFTLSKAGDDDKIDSDITNDNGDATTSLFQINSGEINRDIDVGILPGSSTKLITFPNPAIDKLQLTFNTNISEDVAIYVNSISNEKIKEINITSKEGTNVLDIDLSDLNTGYYRIILEIDNEIIDIKTILKLK